MIAGEGLGIIEMNRLLAGRRQVARARFLSSMLAAALVMIAFPQPMLGQTQNGNLTVYKKVTNYTWPSTSTFAIKAVCTNGYTHTQSLLTPNISWSLNPMPYGTTCTIWEVQYPAPFVQNGQLCTWHQVAPMSQTVPINSPSKAVYVTNGYQCQTGTGILKVTKLVTGSLPTQPTTTFGIGVVCGWMQAFGFNLANGDSRTLSPYTLGTVCKIYEANLPPPFTYNGKTCTWYHVSPSTMTVMIIAPTQTVIVSNSYHCV